MKTTQLELSIPVGSIQLSGPTVVETRAQNAGVQVVSRTVIPNLSGLFLRIARWWDSVNRIKEKFYTHKEQCQEKADRYGYWV